MKSQKIKDILLVLMNLMMMITHPMMAVDRVEIILVPKEAMKVTKITATTKMKAKTVTKLADTIELR